VRRSPGLSVRAKLALSYAGFLTIASVLLLAVVWVSVLRYIPDEVIFGAPWLPLNRSDPLNGFGLPAAGALILLTVFGLLGGWLLAGRMLAPLDRITEATRTAEAGSLSHRIRLPGRRDEFRELADAFDAMLARLDAHVAEQGRFAANASHELRTPLAITQTLLEVARNDGRHGDDELVVRLLAVNARAIDLTEALLVLGRADQRSFVREPVDLSLVAEEATETVLPLAEARGIALETTGEVARTLGSHALLLQSCTNLVHNAIVHNAGERPAVWVTTGARPDGVLLTVENTGVPLTPGLVSTLAEPFRRGTERVRTGHAGVGLGLAIVARIVEAHDGSLTLAPRAGGGLRVTVLLPAAPPDDGGGARASRAPGRPGGPG
jgi:two-component system sensor histidine kinase VanS